MMPIISKRKIKSKKKENLGYVKQKENESQSSNAYLKLQRGNLKCTNV